MRQIGAALRNNAVFHAVTVRSTVLPATMRTRLLPILEHATQGKLGSAFGLVYLPEFMREGSGVSDFKDAPRAVIGEFDAPSADSVSELFGPFARAVHRVSPEIAEATKYVDNCWHGLKVAFANEIGAVCHAAGLDSTGLMDLFIKDTRLNISEAYLKPGFAFGGSCLSKDISALVRWAKETNLALPLISQIEPGNTHHLQRTVQWLIGNGGVRYALIGLAYKAGTNDVRSSPYVRIANDLRLAGKQVRAYDPSVAARSDNGDGLRGFVSNDLVEVVAWADTIVLCSGVADLGQVAALAGDKLILDFANLADGLPFANRRTFV